MNEGVFQFGLTSFVTLLVIVDPFGLIPVFSALTSGMDRAAAGGVLRRAIGIALTVCLLFLVAGQTLLSYLGVSVHAFSISGGILLFATALPMLFGQRAGLQSPEPDEKETPDVAVFPLAIPLLSGPGVLTSILLLSSQARGGALRLGALALAVFAVFLVSWLVLNFGVRLLARVSEAGLHVVTRVLGLLLAALAVQFVLNGIRGFYLSLAAG